MYEDIDWEQENAEMDAQEAEAQGAYSDDATNAEVYNRFVRSVCVNPVLDDTGWDGWLRKHHPSLTDAEVASVRRAIREHLGKCYDDYCAKRAAGKVEYNRAVDCRTCSLCGGPTEWPAGGAEPAWTLCDQCVYTPEAEAAGFTHQEAS